MIRTTIASIFGHKNLDHKIYVTHSGDGAMYVGMAGKQCVANRMARHVGDVFERGAKASRFSKLLFENHPSYFEWQLDVLSISDVAVLTGASYGCLPCAERGAYDFYTKTQGVGPVGNVRQPSAKCECAI